MRLVRTAGGRRTAWIARTEDGARRLVRVWFPGPEEFGIRAADAQGYPVVPRTRPHS